MHTHMTESCKHGIVVRSCRCAAPGKTVVTVPCPDSCGSADRRGMKRDHTRVITDPPMASAEQHVLNGLAAIDRSVRVAAAKGQDYLRRWAGCQWVVSMTTRESADAVMNVAAMRLSRCGTPPRGYTMCVKRITELSVEIELIYNHSEVLLDARDWEIWKDGEKE